MFCPVKVSIKSILFMSLLFFTFSFAAATVFDAEKQEPEAIEAKASHADKKNCREKVKSQQDQIITSLQRIENQIQ